MTVFAYVRVSTSGQTTENQVREIANSGFAVDPDCVVSETVSGSTAIEERPGFAALWERLRRDDVLVVTKLDRLGRNAVDIAQTVGRLEAMGVRVHCLALGGVDLTSAAGRLTMGVIAAMAQFERDMLIERTMAGLERAWAQGHKSGRKFSLSDGERTAIQTRVSNGEKVADVARDLGLSRYVVTRAAGGP